MANRGTKKGSSKGDDNWTGKKFKSYVNKLLKSVSDNATVSVGRGTGRVKIKDIKKKGKERTKSKYVSTGRGTKRRKR